MLISSPPCSSRHPHARRRSPSVEEHTGGRYYNSLTVLRIILWALTGGALIALLKLIEYRHFVHAYPGEIYGGLIAVIFTAVGIYGGLRWNRSREVVVVKEVRVPDEEFELDTDTLDDLGITPREHEILALIAEGLTNREIGDRIFVTESTVKSHAYRLFDKLDVQRRVQAVQKGRELGLIPWDVNQSTNSTATSRNSTESRMTDQRS